MKIERLKNYGLAESKFMSPLPLGVQMDFAKTMLKISVKHFGISKLPSITIGMIIEMRRIKKIDLSPLLDRGIDKKFISSFFIMGAFSNTILKMYGKEKMTQLYYEFCKLICKTGFWLVLYPEPEEIKQFDDPFSVYNQYFLAQFEANKEDNCLEFKIVENSKDLFICEVSFCAWHAVLKHLGMDEMAGIFCYVDDVFFPEYVNELGGDWFKPSAISKGHACCRFVHKRISLAGHLS